MVFDLNEFINQIANALGIATEKVIELYPLLLKEYSFYKIFSCLDFITGVGAVLSLTASFAVFLYAMMNSPFCSDEETTRTISISKKFVVMSVVFGALMFVSYALSVLLAPNVNLLMDIM